MYSLTAKGRQRLEESLPYWEKAQGRLRLALGEVDWQMLPAFTERMTSAAIRAETMPFSNGSGRAQSVANGAHHRAILDGA
jgi:hypothetical protein